ncbi:MAG: hypothetical protein IIB39_04275 [Candidatus Marinimicrobia bacterium]|nr:hypothetical protein [Candidatus Neomarinimicrobiota bacterium]
MIVRSVLATSILFIFFNVEAVAEDNNIAKLQRLFISPTASMLESASLNVSGGGVFGVDSRGSGRSHFRLGLGGVGELAISQQVLFTNIFPSGTTLDTKSLKIAVIPNVNFGKSISMSFSGLVRSSNWAGQESNRIYIAADGLLSGANLRTAGFETRFASFYFISTIKYKNATFHFGPIISDFRYRNLSLSFFDSNSFFDTKERSRVRTGGFIGFTNMVNSSTMMIFDVTTVPRLHLDARTPSISLREDMLVLWGLRYFMHDFISLDTAMRYYYSQTELSDIQVKIGLNVNLPLIRILDEVRS